jgi:selenocysteine lyase/cysteine desulfurase
LLALVTPATRVIAISWVQFQTGAVTDLRALAAFARPRGIRTVVDIIQGLGQLPFDFAGLGLDAACGGCHKWLASPIGVGFLILRPELLPALQPLTVGASTYGTCDDPTNLACEPWGDARRFESGSKQVLEIVALGASARLIRETGVEAVSAEIGRLSGDLATGLRESGWRLHSGPTCAPGFVTFSALDTAGTERAIRRLQAGRISFARRGPGIRLSPHAFNTDDDVAAALAAVNG